MEKVMFNATASVTKNLKNTTNLTDSSQSNQGNIVYYIRTIIGITVILLHLLVIVTILKTKRLRTVSNYFKCGLSIGGIVMGVSTVLQAGLGISGQLENPSVCITILVISMVSVGVILSSVLLLYVEAFLVAHYTLINRNFFSKRCGALLLGATWLMWILIVLIGFGTQQPITKATLCQVNNGQFHRNYLLVVGVILVAHIFVLILLQVGVLLRIKAHADKFHQNENEVPQLNGLQPGTSETHTHESTAHRVTKRGSVRLPKIDNSPIPSTSSSKSKGESSNTINANPGQTFSGGNKNNDTIEESEQKHQGNDGNVDNPEQRNKVAPLTVPNWQNKRTIHRNWMLQISKLVRQISAILASFIICLAPFIVTNFIYSITPEYYVTMKISSPIINLISATMIGLNPIFNFIILIVGNRPFRMAFLKVFKCKISCRCKIG